MVIAESGRDLTASAPEVQGPILGKAVKPVGGHIWLRPKLTFLDLVTKLCVAAWPRFL